jgi:protein O-mannosyl-transferase
MSTQSGSVRRARQRHRRPLARGGSEVRPDSLGVMGTRAALYWAVAVGLAAVVPYLNAVGNEFVLDDTRLIRDNLRIRSLANIPHLFASPYWDVEGPQALYRPLVLASYAVNYAVHGLSPAGYSIVNVTLHAAVSLLLFALVRRIGGSLFAAGVAGLLFAVHPIHTEAVTGISGRPELLAALFFLVAVHLHRLVPSAGRTGAAWRAAALASFGCALLSKESAIMLVLVLPVMDAIAPAKDRAGEPVRPRSRIVTDYVPFIAVALVYLALRRAVLGGVVIAGSAIAALDNPMVPITTTPFGDRIGAAASEAFMTPFAVVAEYARLLVWPVRLSPDYSYDQIPLVTSALDGRLVAGAALVAACLGGAAVLWRRNRIAAFGLAFLALTFSIVSNFAVTIGTICAERLMYLPSAGAFIAAAVAVERLATGGTARRRLVAAAVGAVIAAGAGRTWARNQDWKNEVALWSAAVGAAPRSARVQSEYGRILMGQAEDDARAGRAADAERRYSAARSHFETALTIYPSYSPPMDGLAMIHSLHGRQDEAAALYDRALKAWPGNYASLTNWGSALWERSRRKGVEASALHAQGRTAEAAELLRQADAGSRQALEKIDRAIQLMPSYAQAHLLRAMILEVYAADRPGAIAEFEEVLRLMPNHPQRTVIENELQRLRTQPGAAYGASPRTDRQ